MLSDLNNAFKMKLYLFYKLPGAWFMGVSIKQVTAEKAEVNLPYSWRSQNPFKSIYFAAQCAAAEYSTGILCLAAINRRPGISMLVTKFSAEFFKKANTNCIFTCDQGKEVAALIDKAVSSKEPQTITMESTGRNLAGEIVSKAWITWSFKAK